MNHSVESDRYEKEDLLGDLDRSNNTTKPLSTVKIWMATRFASYKKVHPMREHDALYQLPSALVHSKPVFDQQDKGLLTGNWVRQMFLKDNKTQRESEVTSRFFKKLKSENNPVQIQETPSPI